MPAAASLPVPPDAGRQAAGSARTPDVQVPAGWKGAPAQRAHAHLRRVVQAETQHVGPGGGRETRGHHLTV